MQEKYQIMVETAADIQTFESIKAMYPNEWVLIGNPELDDEGTLSSIVRKLVRGVVLFHSPNKSDMAYNALFFATLKMRARRIFFGEKLFF